MGHFEMEEHVNIIVNREELYRLINSLSPGFEEGAKLEKGGFGKFSGYNPDWHWDLTQLDNQQLHRVFDFYQLVKAAIKHELD